MNKITLFIIGVGLLAVSSGVGAKGGGGQGHASPSTNASGATGGLSGLLNTSTLGIASQKGSSISSAAGLTSVASPTPNAMISQNAAAMGGTSSASGGLMSQLQSTGTIPGIGNSLGSLSTGSGQIDRSGNVAMRITQRNAMAKSAGQKAGKSTVVLGVSRAPKTGDVCIWGAGSDGSCH